MAKSKQLIKAEEIFNSISHGIGIAIAAACTSLLIIYACFAHDVWAIVSFSVFGFSMILLYSASTLFTAAGNQEKSTESWYSMIYF